MYGMHALLAAAACWTNPHLHPALLGSSAQLSFHNAFNVRFPRQQRHSNRAAAEGRRPPSPRGLCHPRLAAMRLGRRLLAIALLGALAVATHRWGVGGRIQPYHLWVAAPLWVAAGLSQLGLAWAQRERYAPSCSPGQLRLQYGACAPGPTLGCAPLRPLLGPCRSLLATAALQKPTGGKNRLALPAEACVPELCSPFWESGTLVHGTLPPFRGSTSAGPAEPALEQQLSGFSRWQAVMLDGIKCGQAA